MSKGKYRLLCVAHPDDETIFFGGLLLKRKDRKRTPWMVICTTSDGSASRKRQFFKACAALGVESPQWWAYPDRYEKRLPVDDLSARLAALPRPRDVYTHGIVGEYGHPHHQDVSYAVHRAFRGHPRLYSVAYNDFPEKEIRLTNAEFETKARVLTRIYGSETSRFLNVLPSTFAEGFRRLDPAEVEAVYAYLALGKPLRSRDLKAYRWLKPYLPHLKDLRRPF